MYLRRNDYALSPIEQDVENHFREFFGREVPSTRVRDAEPIGFDPKLWHEVVKLGALDMAVPESSGGVGSTLIELTLLAEQSGFVLAPVPLLESLVTLRLLARCGASGERWLREARDGGRLVTLALPNRTSRDRQLVTAGSIAHWVIALVGAELLIVETSGRAAHVRNQGSAPLAWFNPVAHGAHPKVLASGDEARSAYDEAVSHWRLLSAAALVGLGSGALRLGVDYASNRRAFGVPIASFQAVSHSLVDAATAIAAGRNLTRKAAWYADHERASAQRLVSMAFLHASRAASQAVATAVHVHGGSGYMVETDVSLFYTRVKTWSIIAGDPINELDKISADLPRSRAPQPSGVTATAALTDGE
jgi:alkylation response protein AidB-like acyl-CoA dehydrogenase